MAYERSFLYSAQRFFIISDNRFLPAGVRRWRRFVFEAWRGAAALLLVRPPEAPIPSNAAIARLSRPLSRFKSATILFVSKVRSFLRLSLDLLARMFSLVVRFRNCEPSAISYPGFRESVSGSTTTPNRPLSQLIAAVVFGF